MWSKSTFLLFTLCVAALLFGYKETLQKSVQKGSISEQQDSKTREHTSRTTNDTLEATPRMLLTKTIVQMETDFQLAKARLLERLKVNYGPEVFETVFMENDCAGDQTRCTIGRKTFTEGSSNSAVSWEKTVRKMKLNILEYLRSGQIQDFVWATAGNDDAAGHGNFFNEQYTMVLQDRAKDMFDQIGLRLITRPFARSGATSAPELAACAKEIYGTDIDIITWDFGMTDGRTHWRIEFFAHRVHILPNHPVFLVLQAGTDPARKELVEHLTDQGMTTLRQDEAYLVGRTLMFPDSKGKSDHELAQMTEYTRYFRCGYGIETGGECGTNRFTQNGTCDDRENMKIWHHGWKWHAFHGDLYSLFLMEVVDDALQELKKEAEDPEAEYERLTKDEMEDYREFEEEADILYEHKWNVHDSVTAMELYRDHTYCHTANIPAQTRYLGHVYNENVSDDWFQYYHGQTLKFLRQRFPGPELSLTYIPKQRDTKYNCNHTLHIDSKDFFLATGRYDGYQTLVWPNDAEVKAYGEHVPKGIIAACASSCSFECGASPLLNADAIHSGKATFRVNGEDVDSVIPFENCFLFVRKDGSLHWPNNGSNQYELGVKVHIRGKYFRFSSFILW
mmetsp:Transcript_17977/g.33994  ORF Transcript_17977/g.33994 Transcript_17977/m.33994 type:complete len:620 (-) Transcript_17977:170-2029(-)